MANTTNNTSGGAVGSSVSASASTSTSTSTSASTSTNRNTSASTSTNRSTSTSNSSDSTATSSSSSSDSSPRATPALLLLPGWDERSQAPYDALARDVRALGWHCRILNFPADASQPADVLTREQSLQDVLAAYDALVDTAGVDAQAIAAAGVSYGGYMAALLAARRPLRWLVLRAPALYGDDGWHTPKQDFDRGQLQRLRQRALGPEDNRALAACAAFTGDALVVESGRDEVALHPDVESFARAFAKARSLTHELLPDADHALSQAAWRERFHRRLMAWLQDKAPAPV